MIETVKVLKKNLGTLEGSIHSEISATTNTPRQIKGMTIHSSDAVNSSTTQSNRNATSSNKTISNKPIFIFFCSLDIDELQSIVDQGI